MFIDSLRGILSGNVLTAALSIVLFLFWVAMVLALVEASCNAIMRLADHDIRPQWYKDIKENLVDVTSSDR